jgi:hypothetical protein
MKRWVLIALASASSAHAQSTPALLSGEKYDALEAYLSCLHTRAHDVDDGISDATSLAKVIAQDCRDVMSTAADTFTRGQSQASRDALYQEWLSKEVWQATAVVAVERKDRQAAHAAATPPVPVMALAPRKLRRRPRPSQS